MDKFPEITADDAIIESKFEPNKDLAKWLEEKHGLKHVRKASFTYEVNECPRMEIERFIMDDNVPELIIETFTAIESADE